jgi:hypothetical protein
VVSGNSLTHFSLSCIEASLYILTKMIIRIKKIQNDSITMEIEQFMKYLLSKLIKDSIDLAE